MTDLPGCPRIDAREACREEGARQSGLAGSGDPGPPGWHRNPGRDPCGLLAAGYGRRGYTSWHVQRYPGA